MYVRLFPSEVANSLVNPASGESKHISSIFWPVWIASRGGKNGKPLYNVKAGEWCTVYVVQRLIAASNVKRDRCKRWERTTRSIPTVYVEFWWSSDWLQYRFAFYYLRFDSGYFSTSSSQLMFFCISNKLLIFIKRGSDQNGSKMFIFPIASHVFKTFLAGNFPPERDRDTR